MKQVLGLLMFSFFVTSCAPSGGVSVIRLSDGKIVGQDSHRGRYRDMVLGCDETRGKIAIIEWGEDKSTIKIFSFAESVFTKHTVPVGRLNGIDGPEYYDFASNEYIFHDRQGIHFFGKESQRRDVANPLPLGYVASKIAPYKGGLLIACGNAVGDCRGGIVYRYTYNDGLVRRIYETAEGVRAFSTEDSTAVIIEDVKIDYKMRRLVRINVDGNILSTSTMPMHTAEQIKIANGILYEVYGDEMCYVQEASLDRGAILREIKFANVSGDITCFDVKSNIMVVGEITSRDSSRGLSVTVLDLVSKQIQKRFKDQWMWSDLMLMKFNGDLYCILSN